jgi:signal transduction histidine kinase
MGMQEIQIGEDKYKLLIIMDVNNIIRDNSIRNQNYYQDAIISTVSHEQMNPLNSIINMSNCLID